MTKPKPHKPESIQTDPLAETSQLEPAGDLSTDTESTIPIETASHPNTKPLVESVETELDSARREAREYLEALQRMKAEFDNFRKRMAKERQRLAELHQSIVLEAILPALDSFDAALHNPDHSDGETVLKGLRLIYEGLMRDLSKLEFSKMDIIGKPFDPELSEALMTQPTDAADPDTIIGLVSSGYLFKGQVLRPARVVVAVPLETPAKECDES
ncbi:nucleotide exchange factor GrpE [bacterium]|nr:nucleotide exchange factor GrpE [candidate division CSSED10-310 bacterium]